MRISDWSSDVCSSDLEPDEAGARRHSAAGDPRAQEARLRRADRRLAEARPAAHAAPPAVQAGGRAARPVLLAGDRGDHGPPFREPRGPHRPSPCPAEPGDLAQIYLDGRAPADLAAELTEEVSAVG